MTREINLIKYLQVTYHIFSNQICFLTGKILKIEFNFVFWQVKSNKFICICVLTGKNPANWFEFLLWHENSNKFIWICVLTKEINLINIYKLLIIIFQIKFAFRQEKSWKLSSIYGPSKKLSKRALQKSSSHEVFQILLPMKSLNGLFKRALQMSSPSKTSKWGPN